MAKAETKIVTDNLHWIGALDFDLRVFDVVMYTDLWNDLQCLSS